MSLQYQLDVRSVPRMMRVMPYLFLFNTR